MLKSTFNHILRKVKVYEKLTKVYLYENYMNEELSIYISCKLILGNTEIYDGIT